MPTLQSSTGHELGLPFMDETHEEFFDLLAGALAAPDKELLAAWAGLISHTEAHFGQEERWMRDTGFSTSNCHLLQHRTILHIMRETLARGHNGETGLVRQVACELRDWFPQHIQSMDAALALHLRGVGYDCGTAA